MQRSVCQFRPSFKPIEQSVSSVGRLRWSVGLVGLLVRWSVKFRSFGHVIGSVGRSGSPVGWFVDRSSPSERSVSMIGFVDRVRLSVTPIGPLALIGPLSPIGPFVPLAGRSAPSVG